MIVLKLAVLCRGVWSASEPPLPTSYTEGLSHLIVYEAV